MAESCEVAGHEFFEVERHQYFIPNGNETDLPGMLLFVAFIGVVISIIVAAACLEPIVGILGLGVFTIACVLFARARFTSIVTSLVCKRCGQKIDCK